MARVDGNEGVSFSAIQTHCLVGDEELAVGTSFFYSYLGEVYLVTAGHNITGRHAETAEPLHSSAAVPDRVLFQLVRPAKVGASGPTSVSSTWKELKYREVWTDGSEIHAYRHPDGLNVDVVGIGPFEIDEPMVTRPVNDEAYDPTPLTLACGDDVFVLGYPHFVDGGASFLPIWKRGSVASDPGASRILIDTATRRGMSGGPTFARQSGWVTPRSVDGNEVPMGETIIGTAQEFIGCYVGRLGERDQLDSQLGIVWSTAAIDTMLAARVPLEPPD
jgi:hypothetical protein